MLCLKQFYVSSSFQIKRVSILCKENSKIFYGKLMFIKLGVWNWQNSMTSWASPPGLELYKAFTLGPSYSLGRRDYCFFRPRFTSLHTLLFGKTLVHVLFISYSHFEWYLLFLQQCNYKCQMYIRSEKDIRQH